jgi:hypothetical protein
VSGPEAVQVLVATSAKPNTNKNSPLDKEFSERFLEVTKKHTSRVFWLMEITSRNVKVQAHKCLQYFFQVLNLPKNTGRFNISTQFPYYREVLYKPDFMNVTRGKPVIFDMDMSPGDFVSLIYLLKEPRHEIDLKV